jgi:uncharacterized membrane protein
MLAPVLNEFPATVRSLESPPVSLCQALPDIGDRRLKPESWPGLFERRYDFQSGCAKLKGDRFARGAMRLRNLLRPARLHPGLLAGCAAWFVTAWLLPVGGFALLRGIIAWDALVIVFLATTWTVMLRGGRRSMRYRAAHYDASNSVVMILCILAVVASLVAITGMLAGIGEMPQQKKIFRLILAIVTVSGSWLFLHTVLALHYAHHYYWPRRISGQPDSRHGGLEFPGGEPPDYADFLYFSFVLGATSQTSDVAITCRPIRRLAMLHGTFAFAYNTALLALTVNVGASLLL